MKSRTGLSIVALAGLALWGCGDRTEPGLDPDLITGPARAQVPAQCDTGDLTQAARGFFSNPEQRDVAELLRGMEGACADGLDAEVVAGGWTIFRTMEAVLDAGAAEDTDDGALLANGLFDFMCDADPALCAVPPEPVVPAALGDGAIFAVRGGNTDPIVGRGVVAFEDFGHTGDEVFDEPNDALWVLLTSGPSWTSATRSGGPILMYGQPTTSGNLPLDEIAFQDLAFEFHSFPDVERFNDGELHVGTCYRHEVELPHVGDPETTPSTVDRFQREGTILQPYDGLTDAACGGLREPFDLAFGGGPVGRMFARAAEALLPRPLYAALVTDTRRIGGTSGSPINFSTIAPVAANPSGRIVFVDPPQDGTAGQPLPLVRAQALSGEGTPMERVAIQLVVDGNEGEPAGASFCEEEGAEDCGNVEFTVEELDGYGTLAEFDEATLYKPGGYRICAEALDSEGGVDFSFERACGPMIHIGNN